MPAAVGSQGSSSKVPEIRFPADGRDCPKKRLAGRKSARITCNIMRDYVASLTVGRVWAGGGDLLGRSPALRLNATENLS